MKGFNTDRIFSIDSESQFNTLALELFNYQYLSNSIYGQFTRQLKFELRDIRHYSQIPFLPIEFFRTHKVLSGVSGEHEVVFTSSSTGGQTPSKHFVSDLVVYETSFLNGFKRAYGAPADYVILALLPGYLERSGSSLVYMFDKLIKLSAHTESGFFLDNFDDLENVIEILKKKNQKTILIGVTYALLDLAERGIQLNGNFIVMETGGMKGKRKELLKEELHRILKEKLKVSTIHSEYGMTELLSQAYSKGEGVFECPPWMRVLTRDASDPLNIAMNGSSGGINIIDLANVNSCAFITTGDLGKTIDGIHFELMGRFDNSDVRGCNLMVE
jgi:phenylacetate-coenzyme A ligase PaaK-like adenylate-forming protein